jgi:hypothetical protein
MNELQSDVNDGWFSTYSVITAQRLLESYQITLPHDELLYALKTPHSFYYRLMKVPLRNVFNGIILQQVCDYQLYAQKLFIDYLLSGESGKNETAPGDTIRAALDVEHTKLTVLNQQCHQLELTQEELISKSQVTLIAQASNWKTVLTGIAGKLRSQLLDSIPTISKNAISQALTALLVRYNIDDTTTPMLKAWSCVETILAVPLDSSQRQLFINELPKLIHLDSSTDDDLERHVVKIAQMNRDLRQCRTDFYEFILHTTKLLQSLPEYRFANQQTDKNLASLHFDSQLGEKTHG